jgi:outer membrane lipoprotein carrier protein
VTLAMRMPPLLSLFLLAILLALPRLADATAAVEYPEDIATRLQARYDAMHSLSFSFFQDIQGEMSGRPRQGSGRALFVKKDGKARMRWDYSTPERQVIIGDGETLSMYFAHLNQLIQSPAAALENDLTYAVFTGRGLIKKDFYIRPADEDEQTTDEADYKVIKIIPKTQQSQMQDIHLYVTADSLIRRLKLRDHFGTVTVLNLTDIEVDGVETGKSAAEVDALFSFTPPPGTEIIRQ